MGSILEFHQKVESRIQIPPLSMLEMWIVQIAMEQNPLSDSGTVGGYGISGGGGEVSRWEGEEGVESVWRGWGSKMLPSLKL